MLTLPYNHAVGLMAGLREKHLLLVSDSAEKFTFSSPQNLPEAQQSVLPGGGHLLSFPTDFSTLQVRQPAESTAYQLILSNQPQPPRAPLQVQRNATPPVPPYILVKDVQPTSVLRFEDPVIGDMVSAVTTRRAGSGVAQGTEYIDFALLPTAQGVALLPKDEHLGVSQTDADVKIDRPGGLQLSEPPPAKLVQAIAQQRLFFPYDSMKAPNGMDVQKYDEQLLKDMVAGGKKQLSASRYRQAQFLLATDRPQEAGALLELIRQDDTPFYYNHQLQAQSGGAAFLTYHFAEALAYFSDPVLDGNPEAAMWVQALNLILANQQGFDYPAAYESTIKYYPHSMQQRLALVAANNLVDTRQFNAARNVLGKLDRKQLPNAVLTQVEYLEGKIFADSNQENKAREEWQDLIDHSGDRFVISRARYALINLQLRKKEITPEQAIDQLEALRISWRGDALEISVLQQLAQLYEQKGDLVAALRLYRELTTNYPELPNSLTTSERMADIFVDLFNKGGADKLPPLEALGVYYDFRELTPIEEAGDQMIQNLADRLAAVDLLDRAAALLQHQVQYRLQGEERSRVGARLALIDLFNKQPTEALKALELTGYGDNSSTLKHTRALLTARALSDLKEPDRALKLLEGDESAEAMQLKLSICWQAQQWGKVIAIGETIMSRRKDPSQPVDAVEQDTLNKLALAYIFEQQNDQLQYLRDYFLPLFPAGPQRELFGYITNDAPVDYSDLTKLATQVSSMENFLTSYRERVKSMGLSGAVQ